MNTRPSLDDLGVGLFDARSSSNGDQRRSILPEETFHKTIALECKRTERSHNPVLLMLLDMGEQDSDEAGDSLLLKTLEVLSSSTRETDAVGWYKDRAIVGVMFTEIESENRKQVLNTMLSRLGMALQENLSFEQFNQLSISFHWFPEEWVSGVPKRPTNPVFYPEASNHGNGRTAFSRVKRGMDIFGSVLALIVLSPVFLLIALAVKLTSEGPVIFRQQRLGQYGKRFTCLKFRSMYVNNDLTIHKEFMKHVIHGESAGGRGEGGQQVYKMVHDPRITQLGHFLRRTSLDELPQFINVLRGDMSLVGPRPPLAYEFQQYEIWHRRRLLAVKPGITGLWQVNGRSKVSFDEMVRLDLRYVRTCSLWLDLRILLQTPRAVFTGDGAF